MHAHAPHVTTVAPINYGKCVSGKIVAKKIDRGSGQFVFLFAGAVTSAAADAKGAVEQQSLLHCLGVHFFT